MNWRNRANGFGLAAILLHWAMAPALVGMFALGLWMRTLDYYDAWYVQAPHLHRSFGLLLLALALLRLGWRLLDPPPPPLGKAWEQWAARSVHRTHYLFMLLLPLTGYLISTADGRAIALFDWFEVPALLAAEKGREEVAGLAHKLLAWGFMLLLAAHAGAALKHHLIDRDDTLRRMLRIAKQGE